LEIHGVNKQGLVFKRGKYSKRTIQHSEKCSKIHTHVAGEDIANSL